MARVTISDCLAVCEDRFELSVIASYRANRISKGEQILVDKDNDKNPVIALREIADQKISMDSLREAYLRSLQKNLHADDMPEETQNTKGSSRSEKIQELHKEESSADGAEEELVLENYSFDEPDTDENIK